MFNFRSSRVTKTRPAVKAGSGIYTDLSSLLHLRHAARDLKLFSRQPTSSMLFGEARSRFRGRGMEFEEVRRYQPGDDIRTIDWRVSARTGKTHTKLFCEERERPVHILVDQRSTMFFGSTIKFKSVVAAELAATIAWAALAGSDRIGGQIIGDQGESDTRARRNKQTVLKFIHDLEHRNRALPTNDQPTKQFTDYLEECRRVTRPGTAVFIISDFSDFDADSERALIALGKHTDVTMLRVYDAIERQLPKRSSLAISNGSRITSVNLDSKMRSAYAQRLSAKDELLKRATRRAKAVMMDIDTLQAPLSFLQQRYT